MLFSNAKHRGIRVSCIIRLFLRFLWYGLTLLAVTAPPVCHRCHPLLFTTLLGQLSAAPVRCGPASVTGWPPVNFPLHTTGGPDAAGAPPAPVPVPTSAPALPATAPIAGHEPHIGDPKLFSHAEPSSLTALCSFPYSPAILPQKHPKWHSLLHTSPSELVCGQPKSGSDRRQHAHRTRRSLRNYARSLAVALLAPPQWTNYSPYARASAAWWIAPSISGSWPAEVAGLTPPLTDAFLPGGSREGHADRLWPTFVARWRRGTGNSGGPADAADSQAHHS